MKNSFRLIATLFLYTSLYSQVGFLNKNNQINFSFIGNVPILSGSFINEEFRLKNDQIEKKRDWIDYGASFSYLNYNYFNFGIGLLFYTKMTAISMPQEYPIYLYLNSNSVPNYENSWQIRTESLKYLNYYIGPKFEFTTKEGMKGVGLNYDLSVGLVISKVINKSYAYSVNISHETNNNENWSAIDYYNTNFDWKNFLGAYLQSGINLKIPITTNFILSYGLHFTIGRMIKPSSFEENNIDQQIFSHENIFYQIQRENLASFNLNLGLNYCF